jgi:hypothetical protein
LNLPRPRRAFVPLAAIAASTAWVACHRSDSILLVEVAGDLTLHPAKLVVAASVGAQTRSLEVKPEAGKIISLPASFSIELAPTLSGPATVVIDATDAAGLVIAHGTTTQQNLNVGGETIITVTMISGSPPEVDAGADAAVDATGGGAGGGSGGSGGAIDAAETE